MLRCAGCGLPFDRNETKAMPFCSNRCRDIDMGNWLSESYSIPCEGSDVVDRGDIDDEFESDD